MVICFIATVATAGELQQAIERGDLEKVKALVNKGNIDARDSDGATLLILASRDGKKEIVKFLLSKGADVNLSMRGGETALTLAAYYGEKDVCELLINSGANVEKPVGGGMHDRTPLLIAIFRRQADVAKLLISKSANVLLSLGLLWAIVIRSGKGRIRIHPPARRHCWQSLNEIQWEA